MEAKLVQVAEDLTGHKITKSDLARALNTSPSTITRRFQDGLKPFTIEEFLQIADHLGLSRATFLLEMEILEPEDMMAAVGVAGTLMDAATEEQLLLELLRRNVATPKGQRIAKGLM